MSTERVIIIDGVEFKALCDVDNIINKLEAEKANWEEGTFTKNGERYFDYTPENAYISKERFVENIDKMISEVKTCLTDDFIKEIVASFEKKKNGTFKKNRKNELFSCDNAVFLDDYCGGWRYYAVVARVHSDNLLCIGWEHVTERANGF